MLRRDLLKTIPPIALAPAVRSAPRLKITNIRVVPLKTVRQVGTIEPAWNPGGGMEQRIGGGSFVEIQTDQGLTGIGPAMDPAALAGAKAQLAGKDPFDIEEHAPRMRYYLRDARAISSLEIAMFYLMGKAAARATVPRLGGAFFWRQFVTAADLGLDMAYVAMFDEVDEGTAVFKVSNAPPTQARFATCTEMVLALERLYPAGRSAPVVTFTRTPSLPGRPEITPNRPASTLRPPEPAPSKPEAVTPSSPAVTPSTPSVVTPSEEGMEFDPALEASYVRRIENLIDSTRRPRRAAFGTTSAVVAPGVIVRSAATGTKVSSVCSMPAS